MLQYSRGLHVVNGGGGEPNKTKNQQQQQNKSPSHCYTGTSMQARGTQVRKYQRRSQD